VAGDMIATEARYHPGCLLSLYRRASLMQSTGSETFDSCDLTVPNSESLALAEVIAYIEDRNCSDETHNVFKLSELGNLYTEQLQKHGVTLHAKLNTTRFKDRLLAPCPDLTAVAHDRDVLLTFSENVGAALKQINENPDTDALKLVHTAKLIRRELFSGEYTFKGTFEDSFSKAYVPQTLLTLISMLLEGPTVCDKVDNTAALTIAQLIIFNAVKNQRRQVVHDSELRHGSPNVRHPVTQETACLFIWD